MERKRSGYGLLLLFGSGETGATGKAIHRKVFQFLGRRDQRVAVLETPAGFQPNSEFVANEVAEVFRKSLGEFVSSVLVVPARRKTTRLPRPDSVGARNDAFDFSPDNPEILEPVKQASYMFLGPGSPTYAERQLQSSLALSIILDRWKNEATLALSSAAALAAGDFTLPVYEIYKAGSDLYWEEGLRITESIGLNLTIITHWNNQEGGKNLDTSRCFMGKDRFTNLERLLPGREMILGIDENTAIMIDPVEEVLMVMGKGSGWLRVSDEEKELQNEVVYDLNYFRQGRVEAAEGKKKYFEAKSVEKPKKQSVNESKLPTEILELAEKRRAAKNKGLYEETDRIRQELLRLGYEVRDEKEGQKIYIGRPRRPRSLDSAAFRSG